MPVNGKSGVRVNGDVRGLHRYLAAVARCVHRSSARERRRESVRDARRTTRRRARGGLRVQQRADAERARHLFRLRGRRRRRGRRRAHDVMRNATGEGMRARRWGRRCEWTVGRVASGRGAALLPDRSTGTRPLRSAGVLAAPANATGVAHEEGPVVAVTPLCGAAGAALLTDAARTPRRGRSCRAVGWHRRRKRGRRGEARREGEAGQRRVPGRHVCEGRHVGEFG